MRGMVIHGSGTYGNRKQRGLIERSERLRSGRGWDHLIFKAVWALAQIVKGLACRLKVNPIKALTEAVIDSLAR